MLNFFNEKTYEKLNNAKFCGVEPFDHVIIDNFLSDDAANILLKELTKNLLSQTLTTVNLIRRFLWK